MKKLLGLSLVLAIVVMLLVPSVAMAASPTKPAPSQPSSFTAEGVFSSIDTGNVKELGNSGKWLVKDRHIQGQFLSGDLGTSAFTITYGGVFDLATQQGNLAGKMEVDSNLIGITGTVAPLTMVYFEPYATYLPKLTIGGQWTGLRGLHAHGSFKAWMIFIPDSEGHVLAIVDSSFAMTGIFANNNSNNNSDNHSNNR